VRAGTRRSSIALVSAVAAQGSVAAEIAVCTKAAGVIERSETTLNLVGPRAALVLDAAGLPYDLDPGEAAEGTLDGAPVTVLAEELDRFLVSFEQADPSAVRQAIWEAGQLYGLAPVGEEALELLRAAHHSLGQA
jgi:glycine cleavage system aminomethyltransferase T